MKNRNTIFDGKLRPVEFRACQDPDGNDSELIQELVVRVENCADGALENNYLVFETKRWAVDFEDLPKFYKQVENCYCLASKLTEEL